MVTPPSEKKSILEFEDFVGIAKRWGPELIFVSGISYYSLGLAYRWEIMIWIDRIAIRTLYHSGGTISVGILMPTIQRHSALVVRGAAAILAGAAYEIIARLVSTIYYMIFPKEQKPVKDEPPATEDRKSRSSISKT